MNELDCVFLQEKIINVQNYIKMVRTIVCVSLQVREV